jgi:hypothetical protein
MRAYERKRDMNIVIKIVLALALSAALIAFAGSARADDGPPPPPPPTGAVPATPARLCVVPDVRRMLVRDGVRKLGRAGCTSVKTARARSTTVPTNRVISQSIRPGSTIDAATTVRLRVSAGNR